MNIITKFEIGDIVYAVHPWKMCGEQISSDRKISSIEYNGADQKQEHAVDTFIIISPHVISSAVVSCGKGQKTDIIYELSNGAIHHEKDIFASFKDAAEYAAGLYEKSVRKKDHRPLRHDNADMMKEIVFGRIRHELEHILTNAQMESLEVEFKNATQGLVFQET